MNTSPDPVPEKNAADMDEQKTTVLEKDVVDVARGGGIALIGTTSTRALIYLYNLALIWGLGVEQFGLFTLAMTIVSFIGLLSNLGMPLGIIHFGAMNVSDQGKSGIHQVITTALLVAVPVSLAFTAASYFFAEILGDLLFHKPELANIIRSLTWGIPFIALQGIFLAATRALKEMKYTAIVSIIQPLFALVLAVILVETGMQINGAVYAYNLSFVVGSILASYFYFRLIPRKDRSGKRIQTSKLLRFSLPLSVTEWMHYANERTEVFFLGLLPGAAAISIYKIAWSLAGLETLLRLSLEQILAPFSSDLTHRKKIARLGSLYKATAKWGFTFAIMLFFVYLLFGTEIMSLFNLNVSGAATVLLILAAAQLFNEFTGACNTILIMSGRSDLTMLNTILLLVITIGLDWWLILDYGLIGAAIAGAAAVVILNILRVLEVWWTLKIHPLKTSFVTPVIVGLFSAGVIFLVNQSISNDKTIISIIFCALFCVLFLFGVLNINLDPEDKFVLTAIKRKIKKIHPSSIITSNP